MSNMWKTRCQWLTALLLPLLLASCFTPEPIPTLAVGTPPAALVFDRLPVSGSEPAYGPDLWNDVGGDWAGYDPAFVQCSTNCYAYALDDRSPLPYGTTLQPGQISGYQMTTADVNVGRIIQLAMADAQAGGVRVSTSDKG